MGIEKTVATQKGKECLQLSSETNSKNSKSSKKNRRRQRKMTVVQRLYDICNEVFGAGRHGIVPPPDDIQRIKSVLGMCFFLFNLVFGYCSVISVLDLLI